MWLSLLVQLDGLLRLFVQLQLAPRLQIFSPLLQPLCRFSRKDSSGARGCQRGHRAAFARVKIFQLVYVACLPLCSSWFIFFCMRQINSCQLTFRYLKKLRNSLFSWVAGDRLSVILRNRDG